MKKSGMSDLANIFKTRGLFHFLKIHINCFMNVTVSLGLVFCVCTELCSFLEGSVSLSDFNKYLEVHVASL